MYLEITQQISANIPLGEYSPKSPVLIYCLEATSVGTLQINVKISSKFLPCSHITRFNAVKCNLMELTTKSTCFPIVQWCFWYVQAPGFHVLLDWDVLAAFTAIAFPLPLSTVNSVWWVSVSPSAWELMAQFPGFASHGSGLHLGAGCQ